jgi:DNA-binding response OmpR family regulator
MRRIAERFSCRLAAELVAGGASRPAAIDDISRQGLFAEIANPPPVGAEVRIAIAPNGRPLAATGMVVHRLDDAAAIALGRRAGVGIALRPPETPGEELFALALERMIRDHRAAAPLGLHAVIAHADRKFAARTAADLADAGFTVATATSGLAALSACLRRTPDVVVVDRALPVLDAYRLIDHLARVPTVADVPVIVVSMNAADVVEALERGARDFVVKTCTTAELVARARRLASRARPQLRGTLGMLSLASLLSLFEHERTTGRLVLPGAWIDVRDGRIVDAATATTGGMAAVLALLDREGDTFELVPASPAGDLELSVTHVLLEHARQRDEGSRPTACA